MTDTVTVGLTASLGALVGVLIKDVIAQHVFAMRKREEANADATLVDIETRRDLAREYLAPLTQATGKLSARLHELCDKQALYFLNDAPPTEYVDYKRLSTYYRVGSVLGWLEAIRRERSYLDPEDESGLGDDIEEKLGRVESALADGQGIEQRRLSSLLSYWTIKVQVPDDKRDRAGAELDVAIDRARDMLGGGPPRPSLTGLSEPQIARFFEEILRIVKTYYGATPPSEVVEAHREQVIVAFLIREAYIYRDWQSAIGEIMLQPITSTRRRFDVIGFAAFEKRFSTESRQGAPGDSTLDHHDKRWLHRLQDLFSDLDMSNADIHDARRDQLRVFMAATDGLLAALKAKQKKLADERAAVRLAARGGRPVRTER